MDYVITVAHGTTFRLRLLELLRAVFWPRTRRRWLRPWRSGWELRERAPWLERRSELLKALSTLDGEGQVRIYPFFWSGRNSVTDRTTAADRLQRKVEMRLARYPQARHFVIAHSHGGNVALYAIHKSAALKSQLAGLVCLSTPFLHARPRDQRDNQNAWVVAGGMTFFALAVLLGRYAPASWSTTRSVSGDPIVLWTSLAGSAVILAAVWGAYRFCRRYSETMMREELQLPDGAMPPVLTIRAPGDEASMSLAAAEFAMWTSNALWSHSWRLIQHVNDSVLRFFDRPSGDGLRGVAQGLVVWVVLLSAGWLWWRGGPSMGDPLSLVLSLPLATTLAALAVVLLFMVAGYVWGPLLLLLWPVTALCLWPFGGRLAIAAAFLQMNVGWSPPGRSEAVLLPDVAAGTGLAHSASYLDPRAIDILVEWIRAERG